MAKAMDEKTLRALVDAGAVKQVRIVADGSCFHVEAETQTGSVTASTVKGTLKSWITLDAAAKWVRSLGVGTAQLEIGKWQPGQHRLSI
jgi:hypothetical protein